MDNTNGPQSLCRGRGSQTRVQTILTADGHSSLLHRDGTWLIGHQLLNVDRDSEDSSSLFLSVRRCHSDPHHHLVGRARYHYLTYTTQELTLESMRSLSA